jgi:hypothetical protein
MKVEFNGNSYIVGHKIGWSACTGCIITEDKRKLKCPADLKGQCILPLNKIYIDLCSNQVFEL